MTYTSCLLLTRQTYFSPSITYFPFMSLLVRGRALGGKKIEKRKKENLMYRFWMLTCEGVSENCKFDSC